MLDVDILDEGLVIVSPAHFLYDFLTKNVSRVIFYSEDVG